MKHFISQIQDVDFLITITTARISYLETARISYKARRTCHHHCECHIARISSQPFKVYFWMTPKLEGKSTISFWSIDIMDSSSQSFFIPHQKKTREFAVYMIKLIYIYIIRLIEIFCSIECIPYII